MSDHCRRSSNLCRFCSAPLQANSARAALRVSSTHGKMRPEELTHWHFALFREEQIILRWRAPAAKCYEPTPAHVFAKSTHALSMPWVERCHLVRIEMCRPRCCSFAESCSLLGPRPCRSPSTGSGSSPPARSVGESRCAIFRPSHLDVCWNLADPRMTDGSTCTVLEQEAPHSPLAAMFSSDRPQAPLEKRHRLDVEELA